MFDHNSKEVGHITNETCVPISIPKCDLTLLGWTSKRHCAPEDAFERAELPSRSDANSQGAYAVMVVERQDDGLEVVRVGMGKINVQAWWKVRPKWKEVLIS